jgi:hypothetical protein
MTPHQIEEALFSNDWQIRAQCASTAALTPAHIRYLFRDNRFGCVWVLQALVLRHDLLFSEDQFLVLLHYFTHETIQHPEFKPDEATVLSVINLSPEINETLRKRGLFPMS